MAHASSHRILACTILLTVSLLPARAQFVTYGDDPGSVRWSQIETEDYRVVYPSGLDSLARTYARLLEQVKIPVSSGIGYIPNQNYKSPMPVILHPYSCTSNGMVAWTPRRMELITTPEYNSALPQLWAEQLAIHESRHVAQMQYVHEKPYRPWRWFLGDLFAGAAAAIYCGPAFFEGDAVMAETELSSAGRGRNGEFLAYYRAAFGSGDYRDYWRWRYGSQRLYTPDYYRAGYITMAGMRTVFDEPDFTGRYYERIFRRKGWPWPLFNFQGTVKEVSGLPFKQAFSRICDTLQLAWAADEAARGPFMPMRQVTPSSKYFTSYTSASYLDDYIYEVRTGLTMDPSLVRTDIKGHTRYLGPFSSNTSGVKPDEENERLWWSEIISDTRWSLRSWSEIWYAEENGRKHRLTRHTRYFNPDPREDGKALSVTEFPVEGGSLAVVLDPEDGKVLERYPAPEGLEVIETAWAGDELYAICTQRRGSGIWRVRDWTNIIPPSYNSLKELWHHNGKLYFTSDHTGVCELYYLDIENRSQHMMTSTRYGASEFQFDEDGRNLIYSAVSTDGLYVYVTPVDSLPDMEETHFSESHDVYPMARKLSEHREHDVDFDGEVELGEPERYGKLSHLFRFHSWIPAFVNIDDVSSISFQTLHQAAGLGATAFFQNDLGTAKGTVAYHAGRSAGKWYHEGLFKFNYSGLYPVLEGSFSISSMAPKEYWLHYDYVNFSHRRRVVSRDAQGLPSLSASLRAYVPLSFSSGGWYRGVVPQLQYNISNSIFTRGRGMPLNRLTASVNAYSVQATAPSCIYPHLGIGVQLGWSGRTDMGGLFNSNAFLYTYGYLPGPFETDGFRLSGTVQVQSGAAMLSETYLNLLPRGLSGNSGLVSLLASYPAHTKLSADYAVPLFSFDWSGLCPVTYVRNLELYLHCDWMNLCGKTLDRVSLFSAGGDLTVRLGNLLWIPFTSRLGVSYSYNFGKSFKTVAGLDRNYIGVVFNINI